MIQHLDESGVGVPRALRQTSDFAFAVIIAIWGTLLLERWKRRQIALAHHWGQRGISTIELPRPRFYGYPQRDPVSFSDASVHFPRQKRLLRKAVSYGVLMALGLVEITGTVVLGYLRTTWIEQEWPLKRFAQQITAMILTVQMSICKKLGAELSHRFNDVWENHRT